MSKFDDGGPAFPVPGLSNLPNSGTEWLDEMIRTSLRDELRGKAIQAYFTDPNVGFGRDAIEAGAQAACRISAAVLAARGEEK